MPYNILLKGIKTSYLVYITRDMERENLSRPIKVFKPKNKLNKNFIWIYQKDDNKFLYQEGVDDNTKMKNTYFTKEELENKIKDIESHYKIQR